MAQGKMKVKNADKMANLKKKNNKSKAIKSQRKSKFHKFFKIIHNCKIMFFFAEKNIYFISIFSP